MWQQPGERRSARPRPTGQLGRCGCGPASERSRPPPSPRPPPLPFRLGPSPPSPPFAFGRRLPPSGPASAPPSSPSVSLDPSPQESRPYLVCYAGHRQGTGGAPRPHLGQRPSPSSTSLRTTVAQMARLAYPERHRLMYGLGMNVLASGLSLIFPMGLVPVIRPGSAPTTHTTRAHARARETVSAYAHGRARACTLVHTHTRTRMGTRMHTG